MRSLQQIQDDEYVFPYHYISQFRNGFTQCFYDSWGINYVATIEFLLKKIEQENLTSCIDIGCGDGRLTMEIHNSFPEKRVIGIDYSAKAISLAKNMNPSGNYMQLNIIDQAMDEQFDLGILMEVFEHIDPKENDKFVRGLSKLLRKNGKLFVTVPHVNKPVEYKHFRHFTSETLTKCFEDYFEVEEVIPFEKGKQRKQLIDNLLGNRFFILNSHRARQLLYKYYKDNLFIATEKNCNRLFVKYRLK